MVNPDYINEYGLVNAKKADINAENAPLWSVEWLHLASEDDPFYQTLEQNLKWYTYACRTVPSGLYNQIPYGAPTNAPYMSPDQLIAFCCYFKISGWILENKEIWNYLCSHRFTYDNLSGVTNSDRTMQPKAIFVAGIAAKSKWTPLLKVLLFFAIIYSCLKDRDQTTGKLKSWTIMKTFKMNKTYMLCTVLIMFSKYKTWMAQFCEYFQEPGCPVRLAAIRKYKK